MLNIKTSLPENMPLTTIVKHKVKIGAEKDFEQWSRVIGDKVSKFKGFKGRYIVPPKLGNKGNEYIVAFQFENLNTLMLWMESKERKEALKKVKEFSEKEMQLEHQEGIDFWFTTPDFQIKRPPKWKMSILTWLAVFPGVVLLSKFFSFLFPDFSSIFIVLLVTLTLVALLSWVLMPCLTRIFKKWLY